MSNDWSIEEMPQGRVRPTPLFEDLRALADRWSARPTGNRLSTGHFESQADAEELLARLNSIRRQDDAQEVLLAAQNFAKLGRVMRVEELQRVLRPYEEQPLASPFAGR